MSDLQPLQMSNLYKTIRQECCYPRENRKGLVTFNTDIFLFAQTVDRNARGLTGKNVNIVYSG